MVAREFLDSLPDEPISAFEKVLESAMVIISEHSENQNVRIKDHQELIELSALARVLISSLEYPVPVPSLELGANRLGNLKSIHSYFAELNGNIISSSATHTYRAAVANFEMDRGLTDYYEFEDTDKKRIQQLVNEIRDALSNTLIFDEEHKQRILKRLEKLQTELHKKVSSFDNFWGLYIDSFVASGRALGRGVEEAGPFLDRVRELAEIAWRVQRKTDALPPSTEMPLLEKPDEQSHEEQPD